MKRDRGFTLVELMVVLSIIAVLLVLVSPTIWRMFGKGQIGREKSVIQTMKIAVKALEADPRFYDLPPSFLDAVDSPFDASAGLTPNRVNLGIESLVAVFHGKGSTFESPFTEEDRFQNLDDDASRVNVTEFGTRELFEYVDLWGNPYVYFRLRDFEGTRRTVMVNVLSPTGEIDRIEVWPLRNERLGKFYGFNDGFQILSFGPDGEFGTDDDLTSFRE
jgi:prepilin-type N-terminal cleavage/methylation domain-containing protein